MLISVWGRIRLLFVRNARTVYYVLSRHLWNQVFVMLPRKMSLSCCCCFQLRVSVAPRQSIHPNRSGVAPAASQGCLRWGNEQSPASFSSPTKSLMIFLLRCCWNIVATIKFVLKAAVGIYSLCRIRKQLFWHRAVNMRKWLIPYYKV